jgi:hypothetical protein
MFGMEILHAVACERVRLSFKPSTSDRSWNTVDVKVVLSVEHCCREVEYVEICCACVLMVACSALVSQGNWLLAAHEGAGLAALLQLHGAGLD